MSRLIVDVSSNNPHVDFRALRREGVVGVYIKATEGATFTSPTYIEQWREASRAGLACGLYHFARQDLHPGLTAHSHAAQMEALPLGDCHMGIGVRRAAAGMRAESVLASAATAPADVGFANAVAPTASFEAENYVRAMRRLPGHGGEALHAGDLRPVLDFEVGTHDHRYSPWRDAFFAEVERLTKRRCILYTYTGFNSWAKPPRQHKQLWLANYGPRPVLPAGYSSWALWQYTDGHRFRVAVLDASVLPKATPFPLARLRCRGKGR